MRKPRLTLSLLGGVLMLLPSDLLWAQGPPGFGGPPGGGFGGPMGPERKLIKQFDKNKDGWLNQEERQAARAFLKKESEADGDEGGFRPRGRFGPPGFGRRGEQEKPKPGAHVTPSQVKAYPSADLYAPETLRTLFLEFETKDWEAELTDFHKTDVEVPATLTVDGRRYPQVGVHFRGMSSYMMVSPGYKRSLNLSLDFVDSKQRLYGYKTLNLLNGHEDASFLSTALYSEIARQYLPAPKANFVKVVINGENWGIYTNVQQFDKIFVRENFQGEEGKKAEKGARWKIKGSPMADAGLNYVGDKVENYKRRYQIKSGDKEASWSALITLCKTLSATPIDRLEEALKPLLDIDSALRFLALDVALINGDGYWIRASDYSLYRDGKGIFHLVPHDMNEAFRPAGGPGFGPPGGRGGPGGFPGGPPPGDFPPFDDMFFDGFPGGFPEGPPPGGFPGGPEGADSARPERRDNPSRTPPSGAQRGQRRGRGGRGAGVELDPLVGLEDARKPLRSRLLAVPSLRARYLAYVKAIAEQSLNWQKLGPMVARYRKLIDREVAADTRKLESYEDFQRATSDTIPTENPSARRGPGAMNLRAFAEQRSKYLLSYQPGKKTEANTTSLR